MSTKTNNSDTSSSNDDGTLYKFDDIRSSTSYNSSELSRDTKNPDSGIGTSISSSSLHNRYSSSSNPNLRLVVKNVKLLDELKNLLKMPSNPSNQSSTTTTTTTTTTQAQSSSSSSEKYDSKTSSTDTTSSSQSSSSLSNNQIEDNTSTTLASNLDTNLTNAASSNLIDKITIINTSINSNTSNTNTSNDNNNKKNNIIIKSVNNETLVENTNNSNTNNNNNNKTTITKTTTTTTTTTTVAQNDLDVDLLVQKAIQLIKKLQKNQSKNTNDGSSTNIHNLANSCDLSSPPLSIESSSCNYNKELIANINNKNEDMCISILVKTGLIVYVDERLANLLGQTAKTWTGRRPIDYLYKNDINLLLTKLCDLTNKINAGCKNISEIEIEPFFLRFKKETNKTVNLSETSSSETNIINSISSINNLVPPVLKQSLNDSNSTINSSSNSAILNDSLPRLIYYSDSNEYIAFRVQLKADKVELKTLESDDKSTHSKSSSSNTNSHQHQEHVNLEACIMFKLSFPTIAYYKDVDNYTERSFISEHDVNLQITRIEDKVTELLGYLPQDLERRSFIKFIHPDDLSKIKQIHMDIFDGKERQNQEIYRWKCHNGCYISVRTNWSWFIHPWKKQIDFIIGKHVVLNEPLNKNIFEENQKLDLNKPISNQSNKINLNSHLQQQYHHHNLHLHMQTLNTNSNTSSDKSNNDKSSSNLSSSDKTSKDDTESDHYHKVEKDIIEYISRKIPGMDDATQMLGQDVIKFIKKKNISASYCQEQNRLIKKHRRRTQYKPIKPSQQVYDYPQYFHSSNILKRSNRPTSKFLEPKKMNSFSLSYGNKLKPYQLKSSSSSNSDRAKITSKHLENPGAAMSALLNRPNLNLPMTSKQASLIGSSNNNKESNEPHSSDESKNLVIDNEFSTENENSNELNNSKIPLIVNSKLQPQLQSSQQQQQQQQQQQLTSNDNTNSSNLTVPIIQPETKTPINDLQTDSNQNLPTLFEDLLSKKSFQPSLLKDKGFFTHYMICKYIDDLPNSWTAEEIGTSAATGEISFGGPESEKDMKIIECQPAQRGQKRSHGSESDQFNENMHSRSSSSSSSSHKESLHKAQPSQSNNQNLQTQISIATSGSTTVISPNNNSNNNNNNNSTNNNSSNIITTSQSRGNIVQIQVPTASPTRNFLGNKTVIDYLLNKNAPANTSNPNILSNANEDQLSTQNVIIFKKTNSYSSKSHSRIVLIDENDNDDEEDTLNNKMMVVQANEENLNDSKLSNTGNVSDVKETQQISIPQNVTSNTNSNNVGIAPFTLGSQFGSSRMDVSKSPNEKYTRLTKENLAKHTRDQDEFYILDILKKVQRQLPKKISETPENICSQNPNVFSRNEYEPPYKKKKLLQDSRLLRERNQNNNNNDGNHSASTAEIAMQYENELNLGPYSNAINTIDFDNPQQYHEGFDKKLQADIALTKEKQPHKSNKVEKKQEHEKISKSFPDSYNQGQQQQQQNSHQTQQSTTHSQQKCESKDKETPSNSSLSENAAAAAAIFSQDSSTSTRNDDVIRFWKKCIRHGSAIVKRLKEADNLIKLISSNTNKKLEFEQHMQNQENELHSSIDPNNINLNMMQTDNIFSANNETNLLKYTKELKKRLYIIASLLGINTDIGFDDISIDSNKSEIIESYIRKIFQELIHLSSSVNLTANFSSLSPKQIDSNSIELLTCIYEDLKQKFLNQFDRFNKESKLIFNSSSSVAFRSSTDNNDDENSSVNHQQQNVNKSSTRSRSNTNKSPNDFEFSSNNTNEYDDSSTYLYDSPTSSMESSDMLSNSNEKQKKFLLPDKHGIGKGSMHSKLNENKVFSTKSSDNTGGNGSSKPKTSISDNSSNNSVGIDSSNKSNENNQKHKLIELSDDCFSKLTNFYHQTLSSKSSKPQTSHSQNQEENCFDDGLICKIMQNYIDLFKNNEKSHHLFCSQLSTASHNTQAQQQNQQSQIEQMEVETSPSIIKHLHHHHEQPTTSSTHNVPTSKSSSNSNQTTTDYQIKHEQYIAGSNTFDTSSDESKSNKKSRDSSNKFEKSENENKIEQECIKNLSLNIYNDCFKCLSKVSAVDKPKSSNSNNNKDSNDQE